MKEKATLYPQSILGSPRSKMGIALTMLGAILVILGAVIPIEYDYFHQPRSFLNNPRALLVLIAILLFLVMLSFLSLCIKNARIAKGSAFGFLVLSLLLGVASTVEAVAWTAGIIDKAIDTGLGLYVMYLGILSILAGAVAAFRKSRKLP